jgi:hypothetical protein
VVDDMVDDVVDRRGRRRPLRQEAEHDHLVPDAGEVLVDHVGGDLAGCRGLVQECAKFSSPGLEHRIVEGCEQRRAAVGLALQRPHRDPDRSIQRCGQLQQGVAEVSSDVAAVRGAVAGGDTVGGPCRG